MKKLLLVFTFVLLAVSFTFSANAALGDTDNNKKITAADARYVLRAAVRLEYPDEELRKRCDVDHDGAITAADARMVLRVAVGLDSFTHPALTGDEAIVRIKPATCTEPGEIAYRCVCGDEIPVAIPAKGHTPAAAITEHYKKPTCTVEGSYDKVVYCKVCKEELSRTPETIPMLPHTPGEPFEENRVETTCAAPGGYDTVTLCTVCGNEIGREHTEIPALPHTPGEPFEENRVETTCAAPGGYDTVILCTVCEAEISREHTEIPALPHTPGDEITENRVEPTCTSVGGYDTVIYCTVCSTELSRVHTEIPALPHTPGDEITENRVEPTCTSVGGYDTVIYCTVCSTELSRVHTEIPALPHTPGEAVTENRVEPTCTSAGGYDTVTYCTACGTELSRVHTDLEKQPHQMILILPEAYIGEGPVSDAPLYYCGLCETYYEDADGTVPAAADGYYKTLADAISAAGEGDTVILVRSAVLTEDLTVPAGVTLLLPYAPDALTVNAEDHALRFANAEANGVVAAVTPAGEQVSVALTLSGCTLTVEKDAMLVVGGTYSGAQPIGGGTYGSHAEIRIEEDAALLVKGTLSTYGYITGAGETTLAGGALYTPMVVTDYHGGTFSALSYAMHYTSPFNSYAAVNVQCPLSMDSASAVFGYYVLYASDNQNASTGPIISSDEGMFRLGEGAAMRFVYHPEYAVAGFPNIGRTEIVAEGDITVQSFQLKATKDIIVKTAKINYPIPWNFSYTQKSGTLTLTQGLRLLPGAELMIGKDAALHVEKALFVFDGFAPQLYSAGVYPSGELLSAAGLPERGRLVVDGVMTVADGAAFGGLVETNGTGRVELSETAVLSAVEADGLLLSEHLLSITAIATNKTEYACVARIVNAAGGIAEMEAGKVYVGAPSEGTALESYTYTKYSGDYESYNTEEVTVAYTSPQELAGSWSILDE